MHIAWWSMVFHAVHVVAHRCRPQNAAAAMINASALQPQLHAPNAQQPLIVETRDPTRSLSEMHCGTGCVIVLVGGAVIMLSMLLMVAVRAYAKLSLIKDRERFARRETELRRVMASAPTIPEFS